MLILGDKVQFTSKYGRIQYGILQKTDHTLPGSDKTYARVLVTEPDGFEYGCVVNKKSLKKYENR